MNSASVELLAVRVCVFDLWAMAPPEKVNAKPAMDRLFPRSDPKLASTNPINLGADTSTSNSPISFGGGACSWQLDSGES